MTTVEELKHAKEMCVPMSSVALLNTVVINKFVEGKILIIPVSMLTVSVMLTAKKTLEVKKNSIYLF